MTCPSLPVLTHLLTYSLTHSFAYSLTFLGVDNHGFITSIGQLTFSATAYASKVLGHHMASKIESTNSDLNLEIPAKFLQKKKKKLAWQEIMKKFSAGTARESDYSVAEEQQKLLDKHMRETYYIYEGEYPEITDCYIKVITHSLTHSLTYLLTHLLPHLSRRH